MIFATGCALFLLACISTPVLDRFDLLDKHSDKVGFVALAGMAMMVGSGVVYLAGVLP